MTLGTTVVIAQDYHFFVQFPDTVAVGHPFEVMFTLENGNGKIEAPEFFGLKVINGPNQSYSTSIVNGDSKQSMSIYFTLLAEEEGSWVIERAMVEIEGMFLETEPATIVVNKDGPLAPKATAKSDRFGFDDFFKKRFNQKPQLEKTKPKMSKRDSILQKYKVKKF